jgi:hypothetical protein
MGRKDRTTRRKQESEKKQKNKKLQSLAYEQQ